MTYQYSLLHHLLIDLLNRNSVTTIYTCIMLNVGGAYPGVGSSCSNINLPSRDDIFFNYCTVCQTFPQEYVTGTPQHIQLMVVILAIKYL